MTSFNDVTINHRVLIDDIRKSDEAHEWCRTNLDIDDWTSEVFDNFDCFYFTDDEICSMFIMIHGGKYIPSPRRFLNNERETTTE